MLKRTLLLITVCLIAFLNTDANSIDSSYFSELKAYDWQPISDVEKVLQHEKAKNLTKRTLDQSKLADKHYIDGVNKMKSKEFNAAIKEFKAAMKRYKRAKLSDNSLNYIRVNMALSYSHTGNKQDLVAAKRYLDLITPKIYSEEKWNYNIAIAKNKVGDQLEATKILSNTIKKNNGNFQAYVTLASIYRDSGNEDDAEKTVEKMYKAEKKLNSQKKKNLQANNTKSKKPKKVKKKKVVVNPKGKKPDITNLKVSLKDNPLQFNKIEKIDDRSMIQVQAGIADYNEGLRALKDKNYKAAQKKLKDAEKKLKRGKIAEDGLNFSRANLAVAMLASGEKRGVGQAKRYLMNLTPKIYKERDWAYNMAVAHYDFGSRSKGATQKDFLEKSVKLFKNTIQIDKLYLTAYQNLIYVYKAMGEDGKAMSTYKAYVKSRDKLLDSFSKDEQSKLGMGIPYVFRVRLGTYGKYDAPIELYDQDYLITVPVNERQTSYVAGMFYNLKDAQAYLKKMQKNGFKSASIAAFKDGEITEF
tara:strand:+ start:1089 stop:2672 length:1584 start_codon:yes stop_codon:yes gene_type:complete